MANSLLQSLRKLGLGVKGELQKAREADPVLDKQFKRQIPTYEDIVASRELRKRVPLRPPADTSGDIYNEVRMPERTQTQQQPFVPPTGLTQGMMQGQPAPPVVAPPVSSDMIGGQGGGETVQPPLFGGVQVNPPIAPSSDVPPMRSDMTVRSPSLEMPGGPRMRPTADEVIDDLITTIATDVNERSQDKMDQLFGGIEINPNVAPPSGRRPVVPSPAVDYDLTGTGMALFPSLRPGLDELQREALIINANDPDDPTDTTYEIVPIDEEDEPVYEWEGVGEGEKTTTQEKADEGDIDTSDPDFSGEAGGGEPVNEIAEAIQNSATNFTPTITDLNIQQYWGNHDVQDYGIEASAAAKPFQSIVLHHDLNGTTKAKLNYYGTFDQARDGQFGYHFAIDADGNVYQTAPLNKRTNHFKWQKVNPDINKEFTMMNLPVLSNSNTIGIAYLGSGEGSSSPKLTKKAEDALVKLVTELRGKYKNLPYFSHSTLIPSDKRQGEGDEYASILDSRLGEEREVVPASRIEIMP
jgi:hypothetical protein